MKNILEHQTIEEAKELNYHKARVNHIMILQDGRFASCSSDESIKIYNQYSFECELSFIGHIGSCTYIDQLDNGKLLSSSGDGIIKIWSINQNSFNCIQTIFDAHFDWINKIISLPDNRFASSSYDMTVKIWKLFSSEYGLDYKLKKINCIIKTIYYSNNMLITIGEDKRLIFWNINNNKIVSIINNIECDGNNTITNYENDKLIIGGNKTIYLIHCSNFQIINTTYFNNINNLSSFCLNINKILIFSYGENKRYLGHFDITTNTFHLLKSEIHDNYVSSIIIIRDKLISSSYDSLIKIWTIKNKS